jgi:hypothetical protein
VDVFEVGSGEWVQTLNIKRTKPLNATGTLGICLVDELPHVVYLCNIHQRKLKKLLLNILIFRFSIVVICVEVNSLCYIFINPVINCTLMAGCVETALGIFISLSIHFYIFYLLHMISYGNLMFSVSFRDYIVMVMK